MVLKPLQTITHCPFARLASSDCFFIGNKECTLLDANLKHSLIITDHDFREQMLDEQTRRLNTAGGAQVQGPFNRLLTVPIEALNQASLEERSMAPAIVATNAIDVSTPSFPRDLSALMGVCVAVIGTRTEEGAGTFNILVHLLPTGHLRRTAENFTAGGICCSRQFTRWASDAAIGSNDQRKHWYLTTMLNIFRGGGWDMTIVTPIVSNEYASRWIGYVDVLKHFVGHLGYNEDAIEINASQNVRVAPSGKIYLER